MSSPSREAIASLCAAACLLGASAPAGDPSQLLRRAMDAPANVSFVGEVQDLEIGESKSVVTIYRIEHRSPDLTQRWYEAPQSLYGDSVVSRGSVSYNVDVKRGRVIVDRNDALDDQVAIADNFDLLAENYRVFFAPDQIVAGRPARVLLLVNKHTGETTMRVWIDSQRDLVLQKACYAANGSLTSQVRFEQIRYTQAIPQGVFDVPSGLPRVQGQSHALPSNDIAAMVKAAGFKARGPKYLPDGFVPVAGDVSDVSGVRTLHLLYSDGIRTASLFQNARGVPANTAGYVAHTVRVGDDDAQFVQEGATTLLAWHGGNGLYFTLVGDMSRHELIKIGASVEP
ncbi:MAG TPA: sigma-E factor regulatory protein RseB domain-containing protein [Verrucomicrobiae bacterium]|jgi:negative regulator of sigma E activity|nr:sigma-E factor regulatory protein RseB domain-containing protein [Verrucomicrobiae bacterium]